MLTERLGVVWGPERNGSRELVGFTREQLRAFSKRTVGDRGAPRSRGRGRRSTRRAERMRADDRASLATRQRKDPALTPERLRDRWARRSRRGRPRRRRRVDDLVVGRPARPGRWTGPDEVFAALVDPATGLCATNSRFGEAHVVERVAAMSAGRLTVDEIVAVTERFLASELVVRLAPDAVAAPPARVVHRRAPRRRGPTPRPPPRRPTRTAAAVASDVVDAAIAAEPKPLGRGPGRRGAGPVRRGPRRPRRWSRRPGTARPPPCTPPSPPPSDAGRRRGRRRPDPQGRRRAARRRPRRRDHRPVPSRARRTSRSSPGPWWWSTRSPRSAPATPPPLLDAVAATPGAQLWCVGDARQAQSVAAGGLAAELERLAADGAIPAAGLRENRRQQRPGRTSAPSTSFRAGDLDASQTIRTEHGWEHEHATPADTRHALAAGRAWPTPTGTAPNTSPCSRSATPTAKTSPTASAPCAPPAASSAAPPSPGPAGDPTPAPTRPGTASSSTPTTPRPDRQVPNGSTGTVLAVTGDGLDVHLDDGGQVVAPGRGGRRVAGPTGPRTCRTPGPAPSTAPKAAPGARSTSSAPPPSTGTPATSARAAANTPPTPGTPAPTPTTPPSCSPTSAPPARPCSTPCAATEPKTFAATDDPWTLDRQLSRRTPRTRRRHRHPAPRPRGRPRRRPTLRRPRRDGTRLGRPGRRAPRTTNERNSGPSPGSAAADATTSPAPTSPSPPPTAAYAHAEHDLDAATEAPSTQLEAAVAERDRLGPPTRMAHRSGRRDRRHPRPPRAHREPTSMDLAHLQRIATRTVRTRQTLGKLLP